MHPGPDLAAPAAASLAGLPLTQTKPLLAELTRAHLVIEHAPGRRTLHDLLRAYATELAHTHDTEHTRRAAYHRMLDHYLHTARAGALLLDPHRDPITVAEPQRGVTIEDFISETHALAWFSAEHPGLLSTIAQASDAGFDSHAWQLAWALMEFLERQGLWHEWKAAQHTAVDAAQRLGDPTIRRRTLNRETVSRLDTPPGGGPARRAGGQAAGSEIVTREWPEPPRVVVVYPAVLVNGYPPHLPTKFATARPNIVTTAGPK